MPEQLLQRFAGGDVEVVGRLVQHQEIGVLQQEHRERQARPLAAGGAASTGL